MNDWSERYIDSIHNIASVPENYRPEFLATTISSVRLRSILISRLRRVEPMSLAPTTCAWYI